MVLVLLVAVGFGVAGPYGQSKDQQTSKQQKHPWVFLHSDQCPLPRRGGVESGRTKVHQEEVNEGNVS